ncbi:MAG TPA: hypothetical protein VL961_06290 [Acidimicrobiales bacterium]|nr:hypothetical protein [Acidimicrobiales bacterium]
MKATTAIKSLVATVALSGATLFGLGAGSAGAASPITIGNGIISVSTGTVPGLYLEVVYAPNSEGVPPVQSGAGVITVTLLDRPGLYLTVTY